MPTFGLIASIYLNILISLINLYCLLIFIYYYAYWLIKITQFSAGL
jgi:hypothetical protein